MTQRLFNSYKTLHFRDLQSAILSECINISYEEDAFVCTSTFET